MKILILVLSCKKPEYAELMLAQQRTWDSISVPGVSTVYYYGEGGGFKQITDYSREFGAETSDEIYNAQWKYKLTLDEIISEDWDLIFRTNSSSYIDKKRLIRFAKTLPLTNCYCGISGGDFASGCGHFISRDCVNILINEILEKTPEVDDVHIGKILGRHGIDILPGAQRVDYYDQSFNRNTQTYHYRCKPPGGDRTLDIRAFNWLFENNTEF